MRYPQQMILRVGAERLSSRSVFEIPDCTKFPEGNKPKKSSVKGISVLIRSLVMGLLLLFLGATGQALAACSTIAIVSSNSHFGMVHRIEAILFSKPNLHSKLVHILAENIKGTEFINANSQTCLIVTIGAQALEKVLKSKTTIPILSVLSRKNIFHQLVKDSGYQLNNPQQPITAIYLDQPLERQLDLISCLFAKKEGAIGVLLGSQSVNEQDVIQKIAAKKGLELTIVYVDQFENPAGVLDLLLDDTKTVLAIPDNWIYNAKTSRGILLSAFHKRVPIVGFSRTFVNNGAIAAVYSTTKQLAEQTAQEIMNIMENRSKKLSPPQYPKDFAIAVNYQVARSLSLQIESEAALKLAMSKLA